MSENEYDTVNEIGIQRYEDPSLKWDSCITLPGGNWLVFVPRDRSKPPVLWSAGDMARSGVPELPDASKERHNLPTEMWAYDRQRGCIHSVADDPERVRVIVETDRQPYPVSDDDARLMAASPLLLKALEETEEWIFVGDNERVCSCCFCAIEVGHASDCARDVAWKAAGGKDG